MTVRVVQRRSNMTAIENLLVNYNTKFDRNSTFYSITRIILQNLDKASRMSIDELALLCFTSPSTISRVVKSLGYKNYSSFQSSLSRCLSEYRFHNVVISAPSYFSLSEQINFLFDSELELIGQARRSLDISIVQEVAARLRAANYVALYPYVSVFMELSLQSDLMYSGVCCDIIADMDAQLSCAKSLPSGAMSIIIAPDGPAGISHFATLLELSARNGNKTCVITSSTSARYMQYADYLFTFEGKHSICDQFAIQTIIGAIILAYRDLIL